jgi:large repetitive protein
MRQSRGMTLAVALAATLTIGIAASSEMAIASAIASASPRAALSSSSTLTASPTDVAAGSTGTTMSLLYTAAAEVRGGVLTVRFPLGFSPPQIGSPTGPGYVSALPGTCPSAGATSVTGYRVSVALTCAAGQTVTIGWSNVTAPTRADADPFAAREQRYPGVATQPLINPPTVVVDPGPATALKTSAPHVMQAGCQAGTITVWAVDQFKNLATGYTGTVKVASDDPKAVLPPPYTFTTADAGIHLLPITFRLPNEVTYTVADSTNVLQAAAGKTLVDSPTSIGINPANGSVQIGATQQLQVTATFFDSSTCDISATAIYTSSKTSVATISSTGLATAVGLGTTAINVADGSTVQGTNLTVVPAGTTTGLTSDTNPSSFGQQVKLTATVTSATSVVPTGSVAFADNGVTLATVPLSGSVATYTTSALGVGSHSITATYSGDAKHTVSSGTASQVVNAGATTTTVSANGDGVAGHPVTLTAVVVAASGTPPVGPTGTVTFFVNGTQVGLPTNVDSSGTAVLNDSGADFATAGTQYAVTATYGGDANFGASAGNTTYTTS